MDTETQELIWLLTVTFGVPILIALIIWIRYKIWCWKESRRITKQLKAMEERWKRQQQEDIRKMAIISMPFIIQYFKNKKNNGEGDSEKIREILFMEPRALSK